MCKQPSRNVQTASNGAYTHSHIANYGAATISRLLKIVGLFCKRALNHHAMCKERLTAHIILCTQCFLSIGLCEWCFYGMATISSLLRIQVSFAKSPLMRRYSVKETYNFKESIIVATPYAFYTLSAS